MLQPIRQRDRIITPEQARNSIYIDFEGEGVSHTTGLTPMPHMLGAYRPKNDDKKARYEAYLFHEQWKPVAIGSGGKAQLSTLEQALRSLIDEARASGGKLVFFTEHEPNMIRLHCPALYEEFCQVAYNLNPPLKRLFTRTHHYRQASRPDQLDLYAQFYFPNINLNELPAGAAETCRKLDPAAAKTQRWRSWSAKNQQHAKDLLDYNFCDCRITWKLTKRLANSQTSRQKANEAA